MLFSKSKIIGNLKYFGKNLLVLGAIITISTITWINSLAASHSIAQAAIINNVNTSLLAAGEGLTDKIQGIAEEDIGRVKRNIGKATGQLEGVMDQAKGKAQQDIGTVKRNIGKATGQLEGVMDQAKGKAQQDIGTTKDVLEDVGDKMEDTSENMIDSVRNLFRR